MGIPIRDEGDGWRQDGQRNPWELRLERRDVVIMRQDRRVRHKLIQCIHNNKQQILRL